MYFILFRAMALQQNMAQNVAFSWLQLTAIITAVAVKLLGMIVIGMIIIKCSLLVSL